MKAAYPGDYHQLRMLPLVPPVIPDQGPSFYPASDPLELGEVPVCVIPDLKTHTDIKRHKHFLEQFMPANDVYPRQHDKGYVPRDGSYLYKTPGGLLTLLASFLDVGKPKENLFSVIEVRVVFKLTLMILVTTLIATFLGTGSRQIISSLFVTFNPIPVQLCIWRNGSSPRPPEVSGLNKGNVKFGRMGTILWDCKTYHLA